MARDYLALYDVVLHRGNAEAIMSSAATAQMDANAA